MTATLRSKSFLLLAAIALPVLTGASSDGCGSDVSLGGDEDEGCDVDGTQYDAGESFTPSEAGACPNSCTCGENGEVSCTEAYCPPASCTDEGGTTYLPGESFPSADGCNTCACGNDGFIACSAMGCNPDTGCNYAGQNYAVGATFASNDGCNNCSCTADGQVSCTEIACACDPTLVCTQVLTCAGDLLYPTGCGPANCDAPIGPCDAECDPDLACGEALSCVDGLLYPTTCGPANCNEPIGPCDVPPCEDPGDPDCPVTCDPTLACAEILGCFEGLLYPSGCGPANCDDPIGTCPEPTCDPDLRCGQAETCFDGDLYRTTCGPENCDEPIGPC